MEKRPEIKINNSLFPLIGFALLLVFSPCKTRNYIQAELGIPQTEVSNKSQSTFNNFNCQTLEDSKATSTSKKPIVGQQHFLSSAIYHLEFKINLIDKLINPLLYRNHSVSSIPFYILYQELKIHL